MTEILLPVSWLHQYEKQLTYSVIGLFTFFLSFVIFRDARASDSDYVIKVDIVGGVFFLLVGILLIIYAFDIVEFRVI